MLATGTIAPDFSLPNQQRELVTLSAFRGRTHVVIAFHPLAFTPVCSTQMQTYERERARFDAAGAHVLAISADAGPSKKAWADALGVTLDQLSDFHPHGQVAAAYGVLGPDGLPERAIFVVDTAGTIRWTARYDMSEQPDHDALFAALARL